MKLPQIIIDTREQTPLPFTNLPTETSTLYTGDYSVKGLEETFAIERKTIADLVESLSQAIPEQRRSCLGRGRG